MEEENTKDLHDYLVAIKKRKTGILAIAASIFVIAALIAFLLPSKYKSSATILIEQQEIPQELVMSTVTSYANERIQVIQARVMSRANLMGIVEKFNLYEDERKYETTEEILERVTDDISLDIISAEVVDPRTGRPSTATIAFSLSFVGESPEKAQRVANELTSLYLNENLRNRTQKAEDTAEFFEQEIERLGALIGNLEKELADFKQRNADMLPELQELNLQMMQRKETELVNIDTRINTLEEKRFYLDGQLAQIDPGNPEVPGASMRLKALEAEYATVKARYSDDHPDVQRIKREIDALKQSTGSAGGEEIAKQLSLLRIELATKQEKYTENHPDVVKLKEQVSKLENELKQQPDSKAEEEYYRSVPDNPVYITLQSQLAAVDSEIRSLKEQKEKITAGIQELEKNILLSPQVEREYRGLVRDYENAVREYNETKVKQAQANAAKQLESENKGERFTLIDPPALPEEPVSPNRPAIIFLGLIFAIGSGLGYAFVADAISGTVRGVNNVKNLLGVAPLAVIPYQMNMQDISRKKSTQKRTVLLGLVIVVSAIVLLHFFVSPLDVLWFRILRKIDILTA